MRPGLFLDRDGVINTDKGYVFRIEDFAFLPGIFDLCAVAQQVGFVPVVVTNQAGIGRGYYSEEDFARLTRWMLEQFAARSIQIERVYHCPFHPTAGLGFYRQESYDRKPNPGMIVRASADLKLDLARSVLIGDKASDIEAGRAAGVGYNVLVSHGAKAIHSCSRLEFSALPQVTDWLRREFHSTSHG